MNKTLTPEYPRRVWHKRFIVLGILLVIVVIVILAFTTNIFKSDQKNDDNDNNNNGDKTYKRTQDEEWMPEFQRLPVDTMHTSQLIQRLTSAAVTISALNESSHIITGSGFFCTIQDTVYVGTAAHVVNGMQNISVYYTTNKGQSFATSVKVIGTDQFSDLALLKCENNAPLQTDINPLSFRIEETYTGESIMTMGNPMGLDHSSPSTGIVKDHHYTDTGMFGIAQLIAVHTCVTPGNSGGAIVDMSGHIVGIVSYGLRSYSTVAFGASGYTLYTVLTSMHETQSDYVGNSFLTKRLEPVTTHHILELAYKHKFASPIVDDGTTQLYIDVDNPSIGYYIDTRLHVYTRPESSLPAVEVQLKSGRTRSVDLLLHKADYSTLSNASQIQQNIYDPLLYHNEYRMNTPMLTTTTTKK